MEEDKEFEILKKDLEDKSQQIKSLQAEIASQKQDEEAPFISNPNFPSSSAINFHEQSIRKTSPQYLQSNIPTINGFNHPFSNVPANDTLLKNYQQQLETLQRKLRIATEMHTEQELNYKNAMKDMELKFRRMLSQRDDFINLRESESNNQQQLISHLQVALEKTDSEKTSLEEIVTDFEKTSDEKKGQIKDLSKEIDQYKKSFQNISVVLLPDIRKLADDNIEDINELTVSSISSMLEKVLLLHKNEQELLKFQVKSLENKIKDRDEASGEKLVYEKKLVEIQQQEQLNNYNTIIENKDGEINSLKSEVTRLETKLQNTHKKFKEEIIKYKANIGESKKISDMKHQKISEERDEMRHSLEKLKLEFENLSNANEKLHLEVNVLKEGHDKDVSIIQRIDECERDKKILQENFEELKLSSQRSNIQYKSTVDKLEQRLKDKENECTQRWESEKHLTEKLAETAKETESRVREEEKFEYENKLNEIKKVIENHKIILTNVNTELDHKNEIIDSQEEKIRDFESKISHLHQKIFNLKENDNHMKATVAQRDGRIIDLQLKLTEFKDHLKVSGEQGAKNSTALENAQQMNLAFQEKVNACEKQKLNVQKSYETLKEQYTNLQHELNQLLSVVDERNREINSVNKDRKAIARKLKEKNDALIERSKENEEIINDLKSTHSKNAKLNKSCEELRKKVSNLSTTLDSLGREKQTIEGILTELEDVKDKEISNLLNRLHGSEADITKLKTVLKKYKMSDTNGVRLANVTQKAVTKQRAEVDHLKTKVTWMKEALEVSEKARIELEESITDKNFSIKKLQQHVHKQQETNQQLSVHLTMSRNETKDLKRALEQAAIKYGDVYALVEKQEECLQRDRKTMQWFADTRYKRWSQDEMKGRMHSTYIPEKVSSNVSNNQELKSLLEDVRDLLSSTIKKPGTASSTKKPGNIGQTVKRTEPEASKSNQNITNNNSTSEKIIIIEPGVKRNTQRLNAYLTRHTFEEPSSSLSGFGLKNMSAPINSTPRSTPRRRSPDGDPNKSSVYSNVDYTSDEETLPLKVTGDLFNGSHSSTLTNEDKINFRKDLDKMTRKKSKKHRNFDSVK